VALLLQPGASRSYLDRRSGEVRITERRGERGQQLHEVAWHLCVLGVPCGWTTGPTGPELVITTQDRRALLRWVPSLATKITAAEAATRS
jgi:hypothetical protein